MLIAFTFVLLCLAIDDARSRHGSAGMTPVRIALPPQRRR